MPVDCAAKRLSRYAHARVTEVSQYAFCPPEFICAGDLEAESVRQTVHGRKQEAHENSFLQRGIIDSRSMRCFYVIGSHCVRRERELFQEGERGSQPGIDRSRPPIVQHCLNSGLASHPQRLHRDRGMAGNSKVAAVETGDKRREDLQIPHRPLVGMA